MIKLLLKEIDEMKQLIHFSILFMAISFFSQEKPYAEKWLLGTWQLTNIYAKSWQDNPQALQKAQELATETLLTFEQSKEKGKLYELQWKNERKEYGSWNLDEQETFLTLNTSKGTATNYTIVNFSETSLELSQVIENDTLTLYFQKK